jgi:hypothetical protein
LAGVEDHLRAAHPKLPRLGKKARLFGEKNSGASTINYEGINGSDAAPKLVVGQDVYMFLDRYPSWFSGKKGNVVRVTPKGVHVQTAG